MNTPDLHECPIQGCHTLIGYNMLLCHSHWWSVPQGLRTTINKLWQQDQGASEEYLAARTAAIKHVNDLETKRANKG